MGLERGFHESVSRGGVGRGLGMGANSSTNTNAKLWRKMRHGSLEISEAGARKHGANVAANGDAIAGAKKPHSMSTDHLGVNNFVVDCAAALDVRIVVFFALPYRSSLQVDIHGPVREPATINATTEVSSAPPGKHRLNHLLGSNVGPPPSDRRANLAFVFVLEYGSRL